MPPGDQVADGVEDGGGGDDDHPGDGVGADGERTPVAVSHIGTVSRPALSTRRPAQRGQCVEDEARVMAQAADVARLALSEPVGLLDRGGEGGAAPRPRGGRRPTPTAAGRRSGFGEVTKR